VVVRLLFARLARRCAAPRRARNLKRVLLCVFVSLCQICRRISEMGHRSPSL